MSALRARTAPIENLLGRSTLTRSLGLVIVAGVVLYVVSGQLGAYNQSQLATGLFYFAVLAGLTMLIGSSGQVSLGHGALMALGAYTVVLLVGKEGWALVPALIAAVLVTTAVGIPMGIAASRLRGPYLAGATLAFAVGLPALANQFPVTFGGSNGLIINPPLPPSWLGASFSQEEWWAWICGLAALLVLFLVYNLTRSGLGRSLRAVRDDEIAASLCGLRVPRLQSLAFVISAACAGLGGGLFVVVFQLATPESFPLQLSLALLTGVVVGGLGSLWGAAFGAAVLTLLPGWSNDISNSLSLSQNVQGNLPFAIYGAVLIVVMLVWPSGIVGGLRALAKVVSTNRRRDL